MTRISLSAMLVLTLVLGARAEDKGTALKSGPQIGQEVPGPFHPLNINGAKAGQKNCLYCENGTRPVAMIFARQVDEPTIALIKKIDAANQKAGDKMGSFVVFLSDDEQLPTKLKETADKANLQRTVLSVDNAAGPKGYNVSRDADVTVVLYSDHTVKANYTFPKGKLNEKSVDQVVAGLSKILAPQ